MKPIQHEIGYAGWCGICCAPMSDIHDGHINSVLQQLNVSKVRQVNHYGGNRGAIYFLDDDRVLKITTSKKTYNFAMKLFNGDYPNLFKPLDLFEFEGLFFILMPRYKKLTSRESDAIDDIIPRSHRCELTRKYNIDGMESDLRRARAHASDWDMHAGNIVKDGNKYIMIDCVYYD